MSKNLLDIQLNGSDKTEPIEISFEVDDEDWEISKVSGLLSDIGWLHHYIEDFGAKDALSSDEKLKNLEPGKYRAIIRLEAYTHPSTPDHGEEYDEELVVESFIKYA